MAPISIFLILAGIMAYSALDAGGWVAGALAGVCVLCALHLAS